MDNFKKVNVSEAERKELHDLLGLTGAEISVNSLSAGAAVPFVHSHRQNEEIYIVLEGKGSMTVDGVKTEISANDYIRISPSAKRRFAAAPDTSVKYVCIQVKANSLENYTASDAIIE